MSIQLPSKETMFPSSSLIRLSPIAMVQALISPSFETRLMKMLSFLDDVIPIAKNVVGINSDNDILFGIDVLPPINNMYHGAVFDQKKNTVIINAAADVSKLILTENLVHELTHARDKQSGRITTNSDGIIWDGKFFPKEHILNIMDFENTTITTKERYDQYMALPWEKEAFENQKRFAWETLRRFTQSN